MGRPLGDGGRRGVGVASCQCFRLTGPQKFWPQVTFVQAPKSCLSHSEPPLPSRDIGTVAAEAWNSPSGRRCWAPTGAPCVAMAPSGRLLTRRRSDPAPEENSRPRLRTLWS